MPRYVAIDTETELIAERERLVRLGDTFLPVAPGITRSDRCIYTSPFVPPRLVLGSYALSAEAAGVVWAEPFVGFVRKLLLEPDTHLVFHNAAFDVRVLSRAAPGLWPLFLEAAAADRLHDTQYLDMLYRLQRGTFDRPNWTEDGPQWEVMRPRSLATLAKEYLDVVLDKSEHVRLGFGAFERLEDVPAQHLEYAKQDAEATYRVWWYLSDGGRQTWSEPLQVRAALACALLNEQGVRIDRQEATRLRDLFRHDLAPLQTQLVAAGLAEWSPRPGSVQRTPLDRGLAQTLPKEWHLCDGRLRRAVVYKRTATLQTAEPVFHLLQSKVRAALAKIAPTLRARPPRTPTGLLSLDADWWAEYIPQEPGLRAWLAHERLKKILNTYLDLYSCTERVFPRWNVLGARSGRMSAAAPNIQNIPKRKHGIRSLFIPTPGSQFLVADYSCQELITLAESMARRGIEGALLDGIRSGRDLHTYTASLLLGKPEVDVSKIDRQAAKAVSFGVPGGLGAAKLARYAKENYHVDWTDAEAKEVRAKYLRIFSDVEAFLQGNQVSFGRELVRLSGRNLESWFVSTDTGSVWELRRYLEDSELEDDQRLYYEIEHSLSAALPTGRIRTGCRFTEASNTYFQGLASDVTKEALFRATRAGLRVVLVVHDELVIEAPPAEVGWAAQALNECMLSAFATICPIVGPYAKVEIRGPVDRWGEATDAAGNVIGKEVSPTNTDCGSLVLKSNA